MTRGPARFLWWLATEYKGRVGLGAMFGSLWFLSLAFTPWLISQAIDRGLHPHKVEALIFWCAAVLVTGVASAGLGIMRHRSMTKLRLAAALRTADLVMTHATRLGAALPRRGPARGGGTHGIPPAGANRPAGHGRRGGHHRHLRRVDDRPGDERRRRRRGLGRGLLHHRDPARPHLRKACGGHPDRRAGARADRRAAAAPHPAGRVAVPRAPGPAERSSRRRAGRPAHPQRSRRKGNTPAEVRAAVGDPA